MTTATVLALLQGDKRNPTRELSLADTGASGNIYLRTGGFTHQPGEQTILWTDHNIRSDGQDRIASSRKNATVRLAYNLTSGSAAHIYNLQGQIYRFLEDAGLFQEEVAGEAIWIKYRWRSDTSLSEPIFGGLSHFLEVLAGDARWPALNHNLLITGNLTDVSADLTCKPTAEGLRQEIYNANGSFSISPFGLVVSAGEDNEIVNPAFGHGTWNTGWTASNASLVATNETTYAYSEDSAVRLVNESASTDYYYYTTYNDGSSPQTCFISCLARKRDGSAVSSSDIRLYVNGAITTTFTPYENGWYHCAANTTTNGTGVNNIGVYVEADKDIICDNFFFCTQNYGQPFFYGDDIGASWSGTEHNSVSTVNDSTLGANVTTIAEDVIGWRFTISGWITPFWSTSFCSTDIYIWVYWHNVMAGHIALSYSQSDTAFKLSKDDGGTVSDTGSTQSFDYLDNIHLCVTQDGDSLRLYVNGVLDITVDTPPTMAVSTPTSFSWYKCAAALDGWRIFDTDLSATEVLNLYNDELEIKSGGDLVGALPFLWTKGGDGVIDSVDGVLSSTAKNNWGVIGGVPGDVPAYTEWHLDPVASPSDVIWLGVKSVETPFAPYGTLWLDFDTTSDVGNSSGDGYDTDTTSGSGSDYSSFEYNPLDEIDDLRGTYQMLARIYANSNASDIKPYYRLGSSNPIYFDTVQIAANASFLFRDLGQIIISWPRDVDPYRVRVGIEMYETSAAANTHRVDFIQLLPHPWCRIECEDASPSFAASDEIIIRDDRAWAIDASDGDSQLYHYHWRGTPVHVRPHRYNYVLILQGEEGVAYPVSDTVTLTVYVTPRYVLPGGPI